MWKLLARILRIGAIALGIVLAAVASVWFGARFADGPIAAFPGGPFTSGTYTGYADVDWTSLAHVRELEFQLVTPPRSRTAWFTVHDGAPYIHCSFCTNRILKKWPRELERDDRIIVRIDGMRIPGRAVRVREPSEYLAVTRASREKYGRASGWRAAVERRAASVVIGAAAHAPGAGAEGEPDRWLFRVEPR